MIEIAVAVIGVIVSVAASYFLGGKAAKSKIAAEQAESAQKTAERVNNAQNEIGSADDAYILERLRERSGK